MQTPPVNNQPHATPLAPRRQRVHQHTGHNLFAEFEREAAAANAANADGPHDIEQPPPPLRLERQHAVLIYRFDVNSPSQ